MLGLHSPLCPPLSPALSWRQFQAWVVGGGDCLQEQGVACQNVLESQEVGANPSRREGRPPAASQARTVELVLSALEVLGQFVQPSSEPTVFSLPLV